MKELYNQLSALGVNSLDYAIEIYKIVKKAYEKGLNDGHNKIKQIRAEIERATIEMDYNTAKEALNVIDKYKGKE